jgi:hypothetical protein
MLLKVALVLLAVWLVGVIGMFDIGSAVHAFLLVGGMLLLLAFAKSRDHAMAALPQHKEPSSRRG